MKKSLASALNQRVELWKNEKVSTDLGKGIKPVFIKNLWADIIPLNGGTSKTQADTEENTTNFKIRIRKNSFVKPDMWIIFNDQRFDIRYILPDYNSNRFSDLFCELKVE